MIFTNIYSRALKVVNLLYVNKMIANISKNSWLEALLITDELITDY